MEKLNLKELKAAVFDWDNTLAESRTALVFCVNKVLQEYNMPEWNIVKAKRDNTLSFRDNFPRIFGDKAAEAYEKYTKIYLKLYISKKSLFTILMYKHKKCIK